jgi:transposase
MARGVSNKLTFKPYDQNQQWLLPPSINELVPSGHLVRVVSTTIDEMDIIPILSRYDRGGGASRFHPLMMIKVLVYGYMTRIFSSRMLAKALRENVMFMWLSGNQKPDFRTINMFRGSKLKDIIDEVFMATVKHLAAKGYVKLENYFIDGTKIESAANKYTFVWKRSIETNERKLDEKLRAYIREAEQISEYENNEYGNRDLEELGEQTTFSAADVSKLADILNKRIAELDTKVVSNDLKKKLKKQLKTIEGDFLPRKRKYAHQRSILGARNSYAKTDPDATFMRMKEDHMKNGQLKPGYNIQIGTENGFVLGYDIFPNPTDTRTLIPHIENMGARLGHLPCRVIADAGYGSNENYAYLEQKGIEALVKYSVFHKEATRAWKRDPFRTENWPFDPISNQYTCPEGQKLQFTKAIQRRSDAGYPQMLQLYECTSCGTCASRSLCSRGTGKRTVQRNEEMLRLKGLARDRLTSEFGKALRKRRAVEVETVFGQIKNNQGFRRFHLRGNKKVAVEWGLLLIGYNIKRLKLQK